MGRKASGSLRDTLAEQQPDKCVNLTGDDDPRLLWLLLLKPLHPLFKCDDRIHDHCVPVHKVKLREHLVDHMGVRGVEQEIKYVARYVGPGTLDSYAECFVTSPIRSLADKALSLNSGTTAAQVSGP